MFLGLSLSVVMFATAVPEDQVPPHLLGTQKSRQSSKLKGQKRGDGGEM